MKTRPFTVKVLPRNAAGATVCWACMKSGTLLLVFAALPVFVQGQNSWVGFGGDPAHTRYSTLNQITPANVSRLGQAWGYDLGTLGRKWEARRHVATDMIIFY